MLSAIQKAKANGAEVTIVLSEEYSGDETKILQREGFEVKKIRNLHGKAIIADDRVLITSANMNMFGLKLNREIGLIIESKDVADFIISDIEKRADFVGSVIPVLIFLLTIVLFWKYRSTG
ncbi:MAG: phospholipase D-like domain-containing protein [Archaeoglobaceae archaeon]